MGLFSSKKTYIAHAASSSLIDEPKSTIVSEVLKASIDPTNPGTAIGVQSGVVTDMYARAKSMLRYAQKDGGYIRGFPESNMGLVYISSEQMFSALERNVPYPIDEVKSTVVGRMQEYFFAGRALKDIYFDSSYFPWSQGQPAENWDESMTTVPIPVVNPDTGTYYEASNLFEVEPKASGIVKEEIPEDDWYGYPKSTIFSGEYRIIFTYTDNEGNEQEWTHPIWLDFSEYQDEPLILQSKYLSNGETLYWIYIVGSGEDPLLEDYIETTDRYGQYFPVAILMQDEVWFDENPDSELAKTTNKLIKKLGTTGTKIREDFEEQEEEDNKSGDSNKSNAKKWDFFIHFAVPIRDKSRGGLRYLMEYFQDLEGWQSFDHNDYYDYLAGRGSQPINEINISEAGANGYNVNYRWSYVYSVTKPGTWQVEGELGLEDMRPNDMTSHLVQRTATNDTEYREQLDEIFGTVPALGTFIEDAEENNHDYIVITRQDAVDDPLNPTYTRTIMMAPSMEYTINTSDKSLKKKGYRYRYAQPTIWDDEADPETEGREFRFPVHASSLLKVPRMQREEALQVGLTATLFLVEVQKKKWYQTGFFKWLIIIVAVILIVLAIYNPGFLKLASDLIAVSLGAAAGGIAAFIIGSVLAFAIGIVISLASSLIGGTWGQIFAIVATIVMFYSSMAGGGWTSIKNSWHTLTTTGGFGSALTFLQAVYPIYNIGMVAYSSYSTYQLKEDWEEWTDNAKERLQRIKDMNDGLVDLPEGMDPWTIIEVYENQGASEQPSGYLARNTETNPGQRSIDLINEFVNIALMPPVPGDKPLVMTVTDEMAQQRGAA